jgi:hypothetical protein
MPKQTKQKQSLKPRFVDLLGLARQGATARREKGLGEEG